MRNKDHPRNAGRNLQDENKPMTATLKENQIKGIPAGTYSFLNDYATRLINKSVLSNDSYKLPKNFLQQLINKSK
jgi:hypothetical protein